MDEFFLSAQHIVKRFANHTTLNDVSIDVPRGKVFGLLGPNGAGKTTLIRIINRITAPDSGEVIFDGEPVTAKNITHMRKQMQMVFQDPYSSLDPRMTVEDIIGEPLDVHKLYANRKERREKILDLMATVGLNAEHATRYAHEFSGGQRQRIGIARALAVNPKFIVCDGSRSPRWTCPFRRRSSTCLKSCRKSSAWRICSSHTICSLCVTSPSALRSCISARSSRLPMPMS